MRLAAALLVLLTPECWAEEVPPAPPPGPCPAATLPHSDRGEGSPCAAGPPGTECEYKCDAGFVRIGRLVCQSYTTKGGTRAIADRYAGGRCERLCPDSAAPCAQGLVPVRLNVTADGAPCFATRCMEPDHALRQLARGAYSLWRLGRNPDTGIYNGRVVRPAPPTPHTTHPPTHTADRAALPAGPSGQPCGAGRPGSHRHQRCWFDHGVRRCRDGLDHTRRGKRHADIHLGGKAASIGWMI